MSKLYLFQHFYLFYKLLLSIKDLVDIIEFHSWSNNAVIPAEQNNDVLSIMFGGQTKLLKRSTCW